MTSGIVFFALVMLAALSGSRFKPGSWYEQINKPDWTPAPWVFPVVWSILYLMIALSGWLVWQAAGAGLAILLWGIQLVLNASWSWQFFGMHRIGTGLVIISAMLVTIIAYIIVSWPISSPAALLFIPYGIWVSIAAKLNFDILKLNRGDAVR
ncbi:MAG: TspO/MBR family protein [Rhizobiaceae bacterium]